VYGGADAEGGRHGPGETEEDEAGWGGVLRRGQEWGQGLTSNVRTGFPG